MDVPRLRASARRMRKALAEGETKPMALATLADERVARHAGTIVGCARRVHGPKARVPTAAEDGAGCRPRRGRERGREITATGLRRATATCGAFSSRRPMPQSGLKELFSRLFIVVRYRV
jgi:hypothetical protein